MKIKKSAVFSVMLLTVFFALIPQHANAQQSSNHFVLEHFKRSIEFLIAGDYVNTILSCNELIRLDPNSGINYVLRARALFEMKEFDRVITDCTHAIRLDRNNASAYVIRGNAYAMNNDKTKAIADWQAALRINPNIAEARENIEIASQ